MTLNLFEILARLPFDTREFEVCAHLWGTTINRRPLCNGDVLERKRDNCLLCGEVRRVYPTLIRGGCDDPA